MSEVQALAKLRDIHLPEPISWWPMAPGWYVLSFVVITLIILLIYFIRRSYKNSGPKREALKLLKRYEQDYQHEANSQLISMKVSELLRRVALVYFPREEVAGLKGEDWLSFLTKTSKRMDFNKLADYLLVLPYQHRIPTFPRTTPTFRGLSAESMDPADKPRGVGVESGVGIECGLGFEEGVGLERNCQHIDLTPLFSHARQWIKQRGKPCSN